MKNLSWPVCGMILASSGWMLAQQGTLSGPLAGFVFDGSGQVVRPIQGVPGASLFGAPLTFAFPLSAAYVAPSQDSAVVVGADQSLHFFRLNGGVPTEVNLGGLSGVPVEVVFSPSGTAAALVGQGTARVLTGLPNSPALVGSVKVPMGMAMTGAFSSHEFVVSALALSDDGAYMLAVWDGSARLLSVNGQDRHLLAAQSGALVAFAAGNHDAAVVDSLTGLTLIRDAAGAAGTQLLTAPDTGLAGPAGLAFSRDEQTLYVASATAQSVAAFNLAGGTRTAIGCACTPAALAPLGNVFRLTEVNAGPLWLLDTTAATPRTVFVPAHLE